MRKKTIHWKIVDALMLVLTTFSAIKGCVFEQPNGWNERKMQVAERITDSQVLRRKSEDSAAKSENIYALKRKNITLFSSPIFCCCSFYFFSIIFSIRAQNGAVSVCVFLVLFCLISS